MASLPKPSAEPRYLTLEELEAIKGTPAFEKEYLRQLSAVAAHDRETNCVDRIEPDEEDLQGWI